MKSDDVVEDGGCLSKRCLFTLFSKVKFFFKVPNPGRMFRERQIIAIQKMYKNARKARGQFSDLLRE